jgi:hypothetical protein
MCEPVTAAWTAMSLGSKLALGMSALGTATSLGGQHQQMKATQQANQQQYDNSMTAYRHNLANIEVERGYAQAEATEKLNQNNATARRAVSTASASAGESGVSGLSVDALLRDIYGQAGYDNTNVEANYLRQGTALNARRENAHTSTSSAINSLPRPMSPNYLGEGLKLGMQAATAYEKYKPK